MIAVMFMGSTIVTPLYSLYAQQFGFSAIMLTLIYAVYVIGNLVSLFFFGGVSDHLGRRRIVLRGDGRSSSQHRNLFLRDEHALAVRRARTQRLLHWACSRRGHGVDCGVGRRRRQRRVQHSSR